MLWFSNVNLKESWLTGLPRPRAINRAVKISIQIRTILWIQFNVTLLLAIQASRFHWESIIIKPKTENWKYQSKKIIFEYFNIWFRKIQNIEKVIFIPTRSYRWIKCSEQKISIDRYAFYTIYKFTFPYMFSATMSDLMRCICENVIMQCTTYI